MNKIARPIRVAQSPKFSHDCAECMFLGTVDGVDMYHCPADGCYIRRTGEHPSQNGALSIDFAPFPPGTEYSLALAIHNKVGGKAFRPMVYTTQEAPPKCDCLF